MQLRSTERLIHPWVSVFRARADLPLATVVVHGRPACSSGTGDGSEIAEGHTDFLRRFGGVVPSIIPEPAR
jgi:hypothetical protein